MDELNKHDPDQTVRVLCICDPTVYPQKIAETPELYQALADDQRIELLHADPKWILDASPGSTSVRTVRVPSGLSYETFQRLSATDNDSNSWRQSVVGFDEIDVAFCRTLKPFPSGYMERLVEMEQHVPFVNSPTGIQTHLHPEFLPQIAPGLTPPMIVTRDVSDAVQFLREHGTVVAKRANSCGGKGVYRVRIAADNTVMTDNLREGMSTIPIAQAAFHSIFQTSKDAFQIVRYLRNVDQGDKRVLVVDGEILGAYLRLSPEGGWVHNVSSGGSYQRAQVSEEERAAVHATWPHYAKLGIHTLGYDFLVGDDERWVISEINAGNIAGYLLLEELTGEPVYRWLIDWLIRFANRSNIQRGFHRMIDTAISTKATALCH